MIFSDEFRFRIIKINISHEGEHTIGISQKDEMYMRNSNKMKMTTKHFKLKFLQGKMEILTKC